MAAKKKATGKVPVKLVDPFTMLRATQKANSKYIRAEAHGFGGNLGDSIERRLSPYGGNSFLGGSSGYVGEGAWGIAGTWNAQSNGMQYGAGQFGRSGPWSGFGNQGFFYLRSMASNSSFNHSIIAQCIMAFLNFGIINRVVNIYADFATEGLEIQHENPEVRNFINAWAEKVQLRDRVRNFFMTMLAGGQVFIHRRWATLSKSDINDLQKYNYKVFANDLYVDADGVDKKIKAATGEKLPVDSEIFFSDTQTPSNEEKLIPWGYTALNQLQMDKRGEKFADASRWVLLLSPRDVSNLERWVSGGNLGSSNHTLPPEIRIKWEQKLTKTDPKTGYGGELELTRDELYVIHDSKFDWFDWAVPFVWPALEHVGFKKCLRAMEMRACETVINTIFLFKLGDLEHGMPAEEEHFERLGDMLQMPGNTMNIIWGENIEAEVLQADVAKLFDPKKHESADRDILMALGIPAVLLGGTGASFSSSFVAVAAVLERLESAREAMTNWIATELKLLSDAVGFDKLPSIKWGRSSLRDETQWLNLVMGLADRGLLSKETLLNEFNISDFATELNLQRTEQKKIAKEAPEVMPAQGPFVKNPDGRGMEAAAKINGRPTGSKTKDTVSVPKPQMNKRPPVGGSEFEAYEEFKSMGEEWLNLIEKTVSDRFIKQKGLKYVKEAKRPDRDNLENLISHIFSHIPAQRPQSVNVDDYIVNLIKSNTLDHIKAEVLNIYHEKIAKYAAKFGKEPSKEHKRQFLVSSWSLVAMNSVQSPLGSES
jgi:hypothetical protein